MQKSKLTKLLCLVLSLLLLFCGTSLTVFAGTYSFSEDVVELYFNVSFFDLENYGNYNKVYMLTQDKYKEWKHTDNTLATLADESFLIAELSDSGAASYRMGETLSGNFTKLPLQVYTFEWPVDPGSEQNYYMVIPGPDGYFVFCKATGIFDGSNGKYYYSVWLQVNGSEMIGYGVCKHTNASEGTPLAPTCDSAGHTAGKYCADCDEWIEAQEEIPALNHKNAYTVPGTNATCTSSGSTSYIYCPDCCMNITFPKTIRPTGHKHVTAYAGTNATCTENGLTAGKYCMDCRTWIEQQKVIPALGHKNAYAGIGANATCTADGLTAGKYCPDCETWIEQQEVIPAIGHANAYTAEGSAPTCVKDGKTGGRYCPDCNMWLVAQETIPATGEHIGMDDFICDECGYYDEAGVLAAAKAAGKAEVNALADDASSDAVKAIVEKAVEDIDLAKSIEEVNAIAAAAKKAVADQKAAEETPDKPVDPVEPDTGKYPKCNDHVAGFCSVFNSFRTTPVLNALFNIIHQLIHAINDFI